MEPDEDIMTDITELTACQSLYAIAVLSDFGWRYAMSMKNGFGTVKEGVHMVTRELSEALLYNPTDKKYLSDLAATQKQSWKSVKTVTIGAHNIL
jgi:hypothetical protein